MNKTFIPSLSFGKKKWYIIDANDKNLGRISTQIANILKGKKQN